MTMNRSSCIAETFTSSFKPKVALCVAVIRLWRLKSNVKLDAIASVSSLLRTSGGPDVHAKKTRIVETYTLKINLFAQS